MFNKIYDKLISFIKFNYKFLIFLTILIFLFYYEFPYIIYKSGGTIDLSERIDIEKKYTEEGKLQMSYVTAMKGTIPFMALSLVIPDWDLMPLEEITTEDNYEEVLEKGKEYLNEGMDNAIIAAFNESGYGIKIKNTYNKVLYVSESANTNVLENDIVISINNNKVETLDDIKAYINTLKVNDTVNLKVINNDKEYERFAKLYLDKDNTLKMGLAFKTTYDYETEIPVTIKMKDNESGSSGGLMMSLSIYNALTEEDITKGLNIVGTGTINSDGTVGEIGGVKYKVLGANKNKADVFLCPKENYEEAINIKNKRNLDIEIVSVNTLKDAINYLKNI